LIQGGPAASALATSALRRTAAAPGFRPSALAKATRMPNTLSEDSPFRAGVLPETQVLLAGQDLLTGLSSRAGLDAHFRLAVARARRAGTRFAVGVADVAVGATEPSDEVFGHDLLVMDAAKRLRAVLRETDVIARIAETRFAFLVEEVTPAGVLAVTGRVVDALDGGAASTGERAAASVGIALWDDAGQTLPALLRAAEERLGAAPGIDDGPPTAANAESFDDGRTAGRSGGTAARGFARRALGWVSLAALIALALAGAPAEWRNRWLPVDAFAQQGLSALRAQWQLFAPADRR
jgi:diguanylate cyclase (GGDEF)-like protein